MRLEKIINRTPLESIKLHFADKFGVKVYIKRDDLNHPNISGNKIRKLLYPVRMMWRSGNRRIISFGGAYSNHLHALSYLCHMGIRVCAFVPLDQKDLEVPSLVAAVENGLEVNYVTRSVYRRRFDESWIAELARANPDAMIVPEGGTVVGALDGVHLMVRECQEQLDEMAIGSVDYWLVSVGTGGTLMGMMESVDQGHLIGVSVVRGVDQAKWIERHYRSERKRLISWAVTQEYHLGGMGRYNDELLECIRYHRACNKLPLDPIYTGKMMLALEQMIVSGAIRPGSKVLAIHTGGLVGVENFFIKYGIRC